jgi:hypothetical protein
MNLQSVFDTTTLPRPVGRPPSKPDTRLSSIFEERRAIAEEDRWYHFIDMEVHTPKHSNITLGDWAHKFVTRGLIPFMRAHGFEMKQIRPLYIEHNILYFLYAVSTRGMTLVPYPKHRNLDKYRLIFRNAINNTEWSNLIERWTVYGLLEANTSLVNTFIDFVYTHLDPDNSRILQEDDAREKKARDDDAQIRVEQEYGSWAWLKAGGGDGMQTRNRDYN